MRQRFLIKQGLQKCQLSVTRTAKAFQSIDLLTNRLTCSKNEQHEYCYLVVVWELACLNDAVNYAGSSKTGRTGYSPGGEGYSPIKVTGYLSENFENTSKRYQNLVLWECPKFISTPKRQFFCIL